MKKFPTSKILKGTLIVAALNVVILPAVLVSPSITLSAFEIEQILLALNNENNKVVSHINKLESNKDSVDTLESSILQTANITDQANQVLLKYNREDIKSHLKIKAVRDQLESKINELKTKNEAFKPILEQNKLFLNTVVQNAQLTVKKAEDKAKKTLSIDLPGLNEAKLELENALKEVDKAKELAKSSKEHTDKLVVLAKRVQKATEKVNNLIVKLNIISQDNDKLNTKYQQELDRLINLLTSKIDEAKNPNLDLVQINSLVEQLKEANTQANRANEIISQDSKSNQQTKAKKDQLADLVKTSEQTIIALNSKAQQIKKDIDDQLDNLSKTINTATSNIEAANNLGAVNIEFSNAQNRISSDIKALKEKIQKVKYDEVLKTANELETKDQQNLANALTKAKSLVSNYLKEADQLTNEQRSSFESDVNKATTAEQLENIQKAIELTNLKEKTKKEINKLELISKQQKDQLNQSVDQQQNDQGIEQILESVNELNKQKESVKEGINQLNNASDQLTKKYNDQLVEADSSEKVQKLLADLKDLDTYKVEKKNEIDALNSLSETDKQNLYEELKSAETKEAVDSVVQKAKNLDQSKKDGLSTLASLSDLSEDDQKRFKSLINKSTTSDEANKALENAKALNEAKKSAKASLEALTNLSTQHKEELKQNIINSVSIEAVNNIKEEAIKLENEKKSLIEEVNKLEHFESTQKEQFVKQIKDKKNIQEANELTSTLKEVEQSKKEVKLLINDSNSKVSGQDKQSLNEELTKATTKEEVAKVKEKLELAKKKLDAVQAINDLTDANQDKKNEFIKQIEQAEDSDEVESILATARNDFVSASKFKAKSEIHKLNYLSQKEQDEFIKTLDDLTLENKQSFDDKLRELTEKNKEKEDLYKSLESKKDLFSPALQQKIKEQLINEDQKDKYTLLANKYDALAKTKEQIKQKIEGLESTGDKNKQDLIAKLTEKEDEPSAKALETEAVELDNLKKELMSSVDTLKNIEDNERQSIKTQIKDAPTKDQAQKLHDNLKLKSQKEQAKNDVAGLSDIDSKKENYKNQIDLAENDEEIQRILNRAKNESKLNKAKSNAKTQIEKLTLISPEHKQRLLNEIASKNDSNEVNKTLTLANELEEFKKENSFQKLNLTEIAKEQNANTKYNELLLNKTTKSEVQNLANEYKSREGEIVKANQAIDKLTNMSQTVRTALKEKVKSAQKDQINNIVNEAKQLDAQNVKNITDLNKLQLLNQQYRTNKTDEIKNQTTIATSNSILKEAQELNKTKQAAKNEIDSNNLLSTKQQSDLNNRLLEANGNTAINAIKQENNKIKAYKQQASTKVNNNKDYLTRSEIDNVTGAIKNANDENETNRKAEESKTLNDAKKKYAQQINGLDLLTSQTKSEAVSYIKTNNGQDPAKQKYDQLKQKNDSKNSHLQLIKSTSEITAAGKRSLEQELRSSDNDQVINNIPQKVNSWKEESLKNSKITTASKTSLTKMKELATNNTQMRQDLENLQNLVSSNTKQDSDSLENLKTKNQNLNNQINSHITKFNKNVNSLINEAKTKAEKPDNLESKEELTKIKEKLEADISKYNEIKQSISEAFGREIDKNGYDNAIAKYEQTKSWIEQKIELATKYSNLKRNVQGSSLSQKDKEKYENNIKNNVKNKDLGTSDFSALETKINEAIKNREDIVNKYTLAKNELKKYVDKLSDTSAITKYTQLNSSHQSISQNYNVLLERVSDKFNSDMGDDEIKNLTHELTEYYETLSYYDVVFQSVKNYISTRSSNDETTDKGWTKYYTLMKPVIDRLATKGSTKNLEFIVGQKALLANAEDEVKKEIFKFEVLRLIGSGKWSKGGNSGTIAFAYFDKDSKKPVLNKEHYSSKFPNFRVEFLTSGIEEDWTRSRYSWTGRVKFHSGDNNDIVLSLKDEHKFLAIPVKIRYDQKTDKKTAHSTNPDRGRWFNENDFANN